MTRTSVFLTSVVSMILGIAIGAVGLTVLVGQLSPNAGTAATQILEEGNAEASPQVYGSQ